MRYVLKSHVGRYTHGASGTQYVTPTPYAPEETISWLALPPSEGPREWVILLDPSRLTHVYGPRWVQYGGGIEYLLTTGFPGDAVVDAAPGPRGSARWEIEVR